MIGPAFPSQAAADVFARRGTFAAKCATVEDARVEIQRLLDGIDGFGPDCIIIEMERLEPDSNGKFGGWSAVVDDRVNEYEFANFTIFDDGDMDWT
jgi:hypothetical protein